MSNHCENTLSVTGPASDVAAFQSHAESDTNVLDLDNFIQMPADLRATTAPSDNPELAAKMRDAYGFPDWLGWAMANWGSKWGAYEVDRSNASDGVLVYDFFTAWSPISDKVMRAMAEAFPSLRLDLSFEEPGMALTGHSVAQRGSLVKPHGLDESITSEVAFMYDLPTILRAVQEQGGEQT